MVLRFNKLPNGQNSNRHLCSGTWKVDWGQEVGNSALRKVREHISANGAANDGHCRCLSLLSCWPPSGRNHSIGHVHTLLRDEGNRKRRELALAGL